MKPTVLGLGAEARDHQGGPGNEQPGDRDADGPGELAEAVAECGHWMSTLLLDD